MTAHPPSDVFLAGAEHADESQLSSLTREAYQRLRGLIITLQLQPGALINDADLMRELGLGRTPIREALQRLACEGLVVLRPRRGAFVASLSITDLQQIFEMRLVIEGQAAALAAVRATEADLAAMAVTLLPLEQAPSEADLQTTMNIDRAFHRALARAAHNKFLEYTLGRMYNLNLRLWYLALDRIGPMRAAIEEHRRVLEAVAQHDGPAAEAAIRAHIGDFQTRMRAVL
jgi:DNA-binding GntR family transcriptional regulator